MRRRALLLLLVVPLLVRCVVDDGEERTCWSDEDCGADEPCEGAVVSGCGGGHTGSCTERLGEGEECAPWNDRCRAGLICHGAYDPPECRPSSAVGGPCAGLRDCDPDLDGVPAPGEPVCTGAEPELGVLGVCALAGSVPTGGGCDAWWACAAPDGCVEGRCRAPAGPDETCSLAYPPERPSCTAGLYCDPADRVCRRYLLEGERCFSDDDRCAPGLFCYSQEAVCHAPLGEGAACLPGDACADGLFCSSRASCRAPLAEGEACWGADRCVEGLFCYSLEAVCHVPLGESEPCDPAHDVCGEGLFCDPTAGACRARD